MANTSVCLPRGVAEGVLPAVARNPGYLRDAGEAFDAAMGLRKIKDAVKTTDGGDETIVVTLDIDEFKALQKILQAAFREGHIGIGDDLPDLLNAFDLGKKNSTKE